MRRIPTNSRIFLKVGRSWCNSHRFNGDTTNALAEPTNRAIESPVNANVWKVLIEEGDKIQKGQTIAILEAMKMEINVVVDEDLDASEVLKCLIQPGQSVDAGQACIVIRLKSSINTS